MSEEKKNKSQVCKGPFGARITYEGQKDFDKYYYDVTEKEVFKDTGEKDEDGNALGTIEKKLIVKKIDIQEYLNSQADTVGVEAYMKALALQGASIDEVDDFSEMPEDLAGVMLAGEKAKAAFAQLDPVLKGDHTTPEGFLNSLTQEKLDSYIQAKIEALMPAQKKEEVE